MYPAPAADSALNTLVVVAVIDLFSACVVFTVQLLDRLWSVFYV